MKRTIIDLFEESVAKYGSKDDTIKRLALHAYMLCFTHPVTGKHLRFETPLPVSFERCLNEK